MVCRGIYIDIWSTGMGDTCMTASLFEILMAVGLGALTGTAIGLFIGFVTKQQRSEWSAMTRREKTISIALVLFFSAVCIAGLAWYMFT
jgi:hypothetical protein